MAGPLQSWGSRSQYDRRDTDNEPTKSGVIGLLAAADGRRREDPIEDLLGLRFGVRVDQPGTILRDYHTVSDLEGRPLLTSKVDSKGRQLRSSGKNPKTTHVTQRFYLQDAVFVAALEGSEELLSGLGEAVLTPGFPLALGRRSCVPADPVLLRPAAHGLLWPGGIETVLGEVAWQAGDHHRRRTWHRAPGVTVRLPMTVDVADGETDSSLEERADVPSTFLPQARSFGVRRVRRSWVELPSGVPEARESEHGRHDPFALLG